jgi:hypothetical protein|tara:strand:+ start:740 stop:1480 length:741 start_codon:yes stop_codon:yes gene_type:complete
MAVPTTRESFKTYCLRRLGEPVVDVNVDDDQVEDRIDDALAFYRDYHYDGTERVLIQHQVTATDKTNKYISTNDNIIGVVNVLSFHDTNSSSALFSVRYQIHLNDLFDLSNTSLIPYYTAIRHIETLQEVLVGNPIIRWNRHVDKLHIDMDWDEVAEDEYIVIDCYRQIDEDTYSSVWKDRWLQKYATQLIKQQWGSNLTKFEGVQLPGGLTFNGAKIFDDASAELQKLEEEMNSGYSLPVADMTG